MKIENLRKDMDKLDNQIIKMTSERFKITRKIAELKKSNNLSIFQTEREKEIFFTRKKLARSLNLNSKLIENIFKLIIKDSKKIQKKLINK